MSSFDQDVYLGLGKLLIGAAPNNSEKIIVLFKVVADATISEGAVYEFMYDYIDKDHKRTWFVIYGRTQSHRRKLRQTIIVN